MKRFLTAVTAYGVVLGLGLAAAALADAAATTSVGIGPRGYDYMIGTWSCSNPMQPSALGALTSTTLVATKVRDGNIMIRTASPNGDVTSYNTYIAKTKMWYGPFADSGGKYGTETTQGTGKRIVWVGTFYDIDGTATPIRDTYTMLSMTKQVDVSEAKVGGAWKVTAKATCSKA